MGSSVFLYGKRVLFFKKGSRANLDVGFTKTLKYLVSIFVVANRLYFFIALKTEFYSLTDTLSIKTILLGDYIYLWFIGALIFAYIILWFRLSTNLSKWMPAIVLLVLSFALLTDLYAAFTKISVDSYLPRFLLSVPFLFLVSSTQSTA